MHQGNILMVIEPKHQGNILMVIESVYQGNILMMIGPVHQGNILMVIGPVPQGNITGFRPLTVYCELKALVLITFVNVDCEHSC